MAQTNEQDDTPGMHVIADEQLPRREQKRIALVLPGLTAGGAERVANIIAEILDRRGWKITVICFSEIGSPSYYRYPGSIDVVRLDLPPRRQAALTGMIAAIRRVVRLRRALDTAAPDVVISFLTRTNILALLAAIGRKTPVIVSERNNPEAQSVGRLWSWLRGYLYPRAFGLVTMTKGAMDYFPTTMRPHRWIIPNPVLRFERRKNPQAGVKWITAVGRFVPQKGFDLLLQAFAEVADDFPDWKLAIWGDGPERAKLEAMALRLDLHERVRFAGISERPGGWVDDADIFVMSSRYEGWGNVLAEALAAGLPAISFDCRWGPGEIIEQSVSGLLVPPENVQVLAQNMRELMCNPELRMRLGSNARAISQAFDANRVVDAWELAVEEALGGHLGASMASFMSSRPAMAG